MISKIFRLFILAICLVFIPTFTYAIHPDCVIDDVIIVDLEDQIECAIEKGLEYIAGQQHPDGYWADGYTTLAATGMMCVKHIDRAKELGQDPFDPGYLYQTNLMGAINHIAGNLVAGDTGELKTNAGSRTTYTTGIADMCFSAAAEHYPNATAVTGAGVKTYLEIVEGLTNWLTGNQQDAAGCAQGGWYYQEKEVYYRSDNSISGYATMGLGFAQSLVGIPIPVATLSRLSTFIDAVQKSGGIYDGGSDYEGCFVQNIINTLKTGNLLYEICLVEDVQGSTRADRALTFLETYWGSNAAQSNGGGWRGNYQAMFTMMKGLEGCGIEHLDLDGGGSRDDDWFAEVAQWIVDDQEVDGSFVQDTGRGNAIINAGWALLTLERAVQRVEFGIPDQCVHYGEGFATFDADDYVVVGTPPYDWTWTGEVDLNVDKDVENVFAIDYPADWVGSETITFTATDDNQKTSDDLATFTVDPVPALGDIPDQTAPFTPFDLDDYLMPPVPSAVTWSYDGNSCLDVAIDGNNVVTVTNPGGTCSDPETITFKAIAMACDEEAIDTDAATFTPNLPPECSEAYTDQGCLWPPNHRFVDIGVMGVTDPDGDPVAITITSITSDEATATAKGAGGKKHSPDADGVGSDTAAVRAERSGREDGRVYVIEFAASDGRGGECSGSVRVMVPHDWSTKDCSEVVDSGQNYDATVKN